MRLLVAALFLISLTATLQECALPTAGSNRSVGNVAFYDSNPSHIWNRLHATIFIRKDLPDTELVPDALDPPLWHNTEYLLAEPSHRQAIHVLDEFLQMHAENLIQDPIKRALLQRDLWAVFDWSVERSSGVPGKPDYNKEREELQTRLADALRRLAPSREQIGALPDNYAQAVASGEFAKEYDPEHRDRAFLPPDLFEPHGPWVELEDRGGSEPLAAQHLREFSGRSSFLIFLRLPEGRKATFDYLRTLWDFPHPFVSHPNFAPDQDVAPNPDLPQFPAGTEVALVRQMTLFDNQGKLINVPITESVQIRVYRSVVRNPAPVAGIDQIIARSGQDFFEIRLSRPLLFANHSGGLRAVLPDEREFAVFGFHGPDIGFPGPYISLSRYAPVLRECVQCHRNAGVTSLNSLSRLLKPNSLQQDVPKAASSSRWWQDAETLSWKERNHDWTVLTGYWKTSAIPR
jgi:hypothetical protein